VTAYPAHELCRRHCFEEVAYLHWHGGLPTREQLTAQNRVERAERTLGPRAAAALSRRPSAAGSRDTLLTVLSVLAADVTAEDDPAEAGHATALRLVAVLPSIAAADQRRRAGLGAIAPRDHLGFAANFLCMTLGKVPEPQIVAAFEASLILYGGAPHAAADPFRGIVQARPDLYEAVGPALGARPQSADAITARAVIEMMHEVVIPDNAHSWVEEALDEGRRIPGFGQDPGGAENARVAAMRRSLAIIASLRGGQRLIETYEALAEAVHDASGLTPTLDYPAILAYRLIGFDPEGFAPILAIARLPGRTAPLPGRLAAGRLTRLRAASDRRTAAGVAAAV
jgi:citrate synthase